MDSVTGGLAALLLFGASAWGVLRARRLSGGSAGGGDEGREDSSGAGPFWLVCFLSFAVAGLAALVKVFAPDAAPVYVSAMGFALSVGLVAALLGAAEALIRPIPEKWVTATLAVPAAIYVMAVLSGNLHYAGLVQVVALIGLGGLAVWKSAAAGPAAFWLIAGAVALAIGPLLLMRAGLAPQAAGHLAAGLGVLALAQGAGLLAARR